MEITKREILASITILALMLLLGLFLSGKINESVQDDNAIYNKALKTDSEVMFKHAMATNIGYTFVYGDLKTLDPVSYPEIDGEYLYIEKVKERYTKHTRTVTTTDSKGKTHTRTETYYTWDRVSSEEKMAENVNFLNVDFKANQFDLPTRDYLTTDRVSMNVRYKYYVCPANLTGTIFSYLSNNNIESEGVNFYIDKSIDETVEYLERDIKVPLFWVLWLVITGAVIYGFYYLENEWLE